VQGVNDHEIERFMVLIPQPYTLKQAEEWVGELAPRMWRDGGAAFAFDLGDGVALGGIGIDRQEREGIVIGSVGYWVARSARGHGLAARARPSAWSASPSWISRRSSSSTVARRPTRTP